jgi:hypothetical protein
VDLKGAIRVFCRVRPLLARERAAKLEAATSCHPLDNTITVVGNRYAAAEQLCDTFISCNLLDITPSQSPIRGMLQLKSCVTLSSDAACLI